ncbi:MAG: tryptophan-rich sensory protein [Gammaproteobacteria bacterium]|nr:tryptophan-rich sensory protein [Gammaproteobacteria bacterium]
MRSPACNLLALAGFVALCYGIAAAGSAATAISLDTWYPALQKPAFTSPDWIFGPVWTLLYALIAVAGWRLWRLRGFADRAAWRAYALQLLLNLAWSVLFFALQRPALALADSALLWLAIAANTLLFGRVDRCAGALLLPYLAWVGYAAALNAAIVALN